jgi:tetratricopeptide (TPR) repeat protein
MMHAIPDMISYDLLQDIFFDISVVYDFHDDVRDAGYPEAINIPMPLKKKIAEENYKRYFITGNITQQDDLLSIQLTLRDTRTTKTVAETSFIGEDILHMVDNISIWLKESLSLPDVHMQKTIDLPASEILTKSTLALEVFYRGYNQCILETNWEDGMKLIKQSVHQDTTFAYAYFHSYLIHLRNNRTEAFKNSFEPLMQHSYKVPERLAFRIKHDYYYYVKQESDLALEVAKTYAELYPEDVKAHRLLAIQYWYRNDDDSRLATYKTILTLDPRQLDVIWDIGYLYRQNGLFKEALEFFQYYADEYPQSSKSFTELGNLHRWFGKYEQARSYYQKALLMEPDKISNLISLARIETDLGNFNKALDDYQDILEKCATPQERVQVYTSLENYYFQRGEVQKVIDYLELRIAEQEKYDLQGNIFETKTSALERYIIAGKSEVAFQIVRDAEKQLGPPLDIEIPFMYLRIYLELEQVEGIEENLEVLEAYAENMQMENIRAFLFFGRGKTFELRGDFETAIQYYIKYLEHQPTIISMHFHIGGCYRKMKEFKRAEEHLQKIMTLGGTYWPEEVFELGLVYADWGKMDKALEYVRRANNIWENADTTYALAMRAREKLAELEALVP